MSSHSIPTDVKEQAREIVERFNNGYDLRNKKYKVRFRGRYMYVDRDEGTGPSPVCRLEYTGEMNNWEFAIYKYSSGRYDPDEWWFSGVDEVDGTIEGALRAGMMAYE